MATVHPEFVIEDRLWYAGELSAPTLRELKQKLPKGTRIEGYYPNGYGLITRPKDTKETRTAPLATTNPHRNYGKNNKGLPSSPSVKEEYKSFAPKPLTDVEKKIMELIEQRYTYPQVASELGMTVGKVAGIIYRIKSETR